MIETQLQHRRKLYFDLSSRIALLDKARLQSLFEESDTLASWGKNQVITLGRSKVFVKRVPVTDLEYDNMFSTRNIYDIPTFYNYGFGSAGLGVFRELVTHIKTTNWVLSGEIATFPLMYHYRLIPFAGTHDDVDMERHARYVKYWGSNANIGRYMLDRAHARYELVLFLEKFPYTVADWILDNPAKLPLVLADNCASLTFLRENGILHLDAHFYNMVTDGNHVYLTDFGLALDKQFDLSPAEQRFYKQHADYDFGYLLWAIGFPLFSMYGKLSEPTKARLSEDYGIKEGLASEEMVSLLLGNLEEIASRGILPLHRDYVATLARYRSVGDFMRDFYLKMRKNDAKDTPFDHKTLRRLLTDVGFAPDAVSAR
jgi:hypothetical protein